MDETVVSFCFHGTQPVWKLAAVIMSISPEKWKHRLGIPPPHSVGITSSKKCKPKQALTSVWHEMINDHPTPSNDESGQFFPWKFNLSHELNLNKSMFILMPWRELGTLPETKISMLSRWFSGFPKVGYVSSFPGGYTVYIRLPFWITQAPTCQRPAHSEVMLQAPSRWDGFPNDSTWPQVSSHSARPNRWKVVLIWSFLYGMCLPFFWEMRNSLLHLYTKVIKLPLSAASAWRGICIWEPLGSSIIKPFDMSDCSNPTYSMTNTSF